MSCNSCALGPGVGSRWPLHLTHNTYLPPTLVARNLLSILYSLSGSMTSMVTSPAVASWVRRPNALGSETRRHEPVVHVERVHSARAEPCIAGHERVTIERQHTTVKSALNQRCGVLCDVPQYTRPRNSGRARCRAGSEWVQRGRKD